MRNVTEQIPNQEWRTNAEVLLNFCQSVVRPDCDRLKVAMADYAASLQRLPESKAA